MRIIIALILILLLPVVFPSLIFANIEGTNVVINEIQISGNNSTDEFVELYNPTESDIDMTSWKLKKIAGTGSEANLDSSISGTIKAKSYYLLAHAEYQGSVSPDENYSTTANIPSNGGARLYSDLDEIIDTVGLGTGVASESATTFSPSNFQSVSRTNGIDTDNNFNDFVLNDVSDPQNSASVSATPAPSPTPTEGPTPEASQPGGQASPSTEPSPEVSPSPSPSPEPTPEVTPTPSPSPSPSIEPSPAPFLLTNRPFFVLEKIFNNVCMNENGNGKKMGRINSRLLSLLCI